MNLIQRPPLHTSGQRFREKQPFRNIDEVRHASIDSLHTFDSVSNSKPKAKHFQGRAMSRDIQQAPSQLINKSAMSQQRPVT
jgi:hypothetical protein